MYSIGDYGDMIADKVRMDPYVYALKAVIETNSVVLDIGTGPRSIGHRKRDHDR
jgi:hypothetical protein